MSGRDPYYDLVAAIDIAAPGIVLQRESLDAVADAYVAGGSVPLTNAQIVAIAGPLPPVPTSIPRIDKYSDEVREGFCP
ncbi:MAG TPA: hypothetical protein VGV37_02545 [Aliidongia sp.]|uniref:hypothetical protein n=1 Tax=Aliidongia sp. TaxID=1914230 RepID=UPI002DDCFE0C|nr:hypothetical protein [Aliidongia sp.]HEV2673390.1 hypothetical protein [Aliidongia sp.]